MEARLPQHICFKTENDNREASPEVRQRNPNPSTELKEITPLLKVEHLESYYSIDQNARNGILTPPTSKSEMPRKAFLFLPKMDTRNRLTSTPNEERTQFRPDLSRHMNEAFNLSPTGCVEPDSYGPSLSCLEDEGDIDDIRSVLFPPHQFNQNNISHSQDSAMFSLDIAGEQKQTKSSKSKPDSSTTNLKTTLSLTVPEGISVSLFKAQKQQQNHTQSFQDSGIESAMASINDSSCQLREKSLPSSPFKRRAENTGRSLESPMKRLAFMSLEGLQQNLSTSPSFHQRLEKFDMSKPGSSFLFDRTVPIECENYFSADLSPPPPIFANTVPSISLTKNLHADPTTLLVPIRSSEDFKFTKPFVRPLKERGTASKMYTFKTVDPVAGGHMGERYFDIIGGLARRNLHHIVAKILADIRQKDVLRCSRVSCFWADVCQNNIFARGTIKALKKQYRDEEFNRGSENFTAKEAVENAFLKSPAKLGSIRNFSSGRSALCNLQARAKRTPTKQIIMPKTPSGKNYYVSAESKFEHHQGVKRSLDFGEATRLCPRCSWTAKVYEGDDNKGQCYRVDCRYTFCTLCNMKYHSPRPCRVKTIATSPTEVEKTVKAGSKKSKERLKRRLLL